MLVEKKNGGHMAESLEGLIEELSVVRRMMRERRRRYIDRLEKIKKEKDSGDTDPGRSS